MANTSVLTAFEKMWQYIVSALGNKANNSDIYNLEIMLDTKVPTSRRINSMCLYDDIILTASNVGLGFVDNTKDINKPVPTKQ